MSISLAAVADLLDDVQTVGVDQSAEAALAVPVVDASHDSRQIEAGWLYFCVPGANVDGHDYADAAKTAGAVALVVERVLPVDLPQLVVSNVRASMGHMAAAIHGNPSSELTIVGVTGTNGKSSCVQLLSDIWKQSGARNEILGTLTNKRTTPEATDLQRHLRTLIDRRIDHLAMEVSSHALSMGRVNGTAFACSAFTNLGRDHLDFHETVEAYFQAKATLFNSALSAQSVINTDDQYGRRLFESTSIPSTAFGIADATGITFNRASSTFTWSDLPVTLHLAGAHNVLNALTAATCAKQLGVPVEDIADALCATQPVRGRFEFVDVGQAFTVAVDYAHTPDALSAALDASRHAANVEADGRVILVFGCGGDRDVEKRPEMGRVAEGGADVIIVTSDNPRSEKPQDIVDAILEGFSNPDRGIVDLDRESAIHRAITQARDNDIVLIAGKGHETDQVVGAEVRSFDDRAVAIEALGVST